MTRKLPEVEIKAIINHHYPSTINFKELNGGLVSQTYYFEADKNQCILQVGSGLESYEKEKLIYNNFNSNLPVRKVLEVHKTENEIAYSISSFIEGNKLFDLNSQELLDIVPAVMEILETLESVELPDKAGYGHYDKMGQATYPTWLAFIKAVYNENIYKWSALEKNGLDSEVVKLAIQEIKAHINSVTLNKKHLVHGDLGSFNLLAKDDEITGIIDWSLSLYGDHLYDIANILFWNEDKLQSLVQQITTKYINSLEAKEKVYCYMLRIGLEEIYNTVILDEVGFDIEWIANRLQKVIDSFLKD